MGITTPNMSIYIPAAGETNYDAAFAAGMANVDQHDHTGGPNKGVLIGSAGLAPGSVTYDKLNANVVDKVATGLDTHTGGLANQITTVGLLKSFAAAALSGIVSVNGTTVVSRTITPVANQTTVTNGDGIAGPPVIGLDSTIYTNISFDSGANTLDAYTTGTFVPALSFGGASVGITYTTQVGKYWKIGKVVFFNINILLSNKGSSTGAARISGPLFLAASDGLNSITAVKAVLITWAGYIIGEISPSAPNTILIDLIAISAAGNVAFTDPNFTNTSQISLSGFYWTA